MFIFLIAENGRMVQFSIDGNILAAEKKYLSWSISEFKHVTIYLLRILAVWLPFSRDGLHEEMRNSIDKHRNQEKTSLQGLFHTGRPVLQVYFSILIK